MKKYHLLALILLGLFLGLYVSGKTRAFSINKPQEAKQFEGFQQIIQDGLLLLRERKDNVALIIFEKILITQPQNLDALWGKAEVLRRRYQFKEAEELLNKILKVNPNYPAALNSLAYIKYREGKLGVALKIINRILKIKSLDRENQALAYLTLGAINSWRATHGWPINKIQYGTQIKCYFQRAKEICPELAETHLGLGTFFLKAPAIVGGNIDNAIKELELAIKIAPNFAAVNARLAQAYQKIGLEDEFKYYLIKAKNLDPQNEVLKEIIE
ncbi:MAG: tetratricopeptide repeat protein [Candidatus Omnitrophota bacterium]